MTTVRPLLRLGVIDQGETAVRVLNAVGELNHAGGGPTIVTVLFHRDAESRPWYSREADDVRALAAPWTEEAIVASLQSAHVDTVWIGAWTPGARADLVAACEAGGLAVVGPHAATVRRLADPRTLTGLKIDGGRLASGARTRRVEVDVLADDHGAVWVLGERDVCVSAPHGAPKLLLAEAPCAAIDADLTARLRAAAGEIVRALHYRGAGTIEFAHDGRHFELRGFDTAVAPEHAATEERTGTSVIGWRLRVQRGEPLGEEPAGGGVVFEARLLMEDAAAGPSAPGRVALLSFPVGTGVRVDANRRPGDPVDASDPLVALVTVWGPDRPVALARMRRALSRTAVVIDGRTTNRTLLLALLGHEDFVRGDVDEHWSARAIGPRTAAAPEAIPLLAAAVEAYEADRALALAAFFATAARGRPEQPARVGARIELDYGGVGYRLDVDCIGPARYTVRNDGRSADLTVDALNAYERRITCAGRRHQVLVAPTPFGYRIEFEGRSHPFAREDGVAVRSDRPALVVAVQVRPGQQVSAGEPIAVLESMKMESTFTAPLDGEVVAVAVAPNMQVEAGALLVRVRPASAAEGVQEAAPATAAPVAIELTGLEQPIDFTRKPCERVYEPLGDYLLGYDLSAAARTKLLTQQRRMAEIAEPADAALLACEDGLLDVYADLGTLYRPQSEPEPDELGAHRESTQEHLIAFLKWLDADRAGLPAGYRAALAKALGRFGVTSLERGAALESALMRLFSSFARLAELAPVIVAILQRRIAHRDALLPAANAEAKGRLDRLAEVMHGRQQAIADLARDLRFHLFDEPPMEAAAATLRAEMSAHLAHLAQDPASPDRAARITRLVECPQPMRALLLEHWRAAPVPSDATARLLLEVHVRRYYRGCELGPIGYAERDGQRFAHTDFTLDGRAWRLVVGFLPLRELPAWSAAVAPRLAELGDAGAARPARELLLDLATWNDEGRHDGAELLGDAGQWLAKCRLGQTPARIDLAITLPRVAEAHDLGTHHFSFVPAAEGGFVEEPLYRDLHPMLARRLEIWRLGNFDLERRPAPEDVHLFLGVAKANREDRRLFALAEVRELDPLHDPVTGQVSYPRLERTGLQAMAAMRIELARFTPRDRPVANRVVLDVTAPWTVPAERVETLAHHFASLAARVGLEKVVLKVRRPDAGASGGLRDAVLQFEEVGHSVLVSEQRAGQEPIRPLGMYQQKVLAAARFGSPYPYEIARLFTQRQLGNGLPPDRFQELDLDEEGLRLVPVQREPGRNKAHIVIGLITNHTPVVPEGITRVAMLSDPTQGLGNLSEPECRRINAALAYALEHRLPVEWFAVSSGALIAMDSGTENMDWIALTLRRLIEYTQAGGEVNIVVTGINVGGQPYWNAEATMLMHTKGILVMTPASAMVLTGKQALDFSGAVSAEDNFGIGGYDRVMGPNGQGQYFAASFPEACALLLRHYDYCYVVPGERFPRRRPTSDPVERDVCASPHAELEGSPFRTVGDLFSPALNAERKQPFDMRSVMRAVADADAESIERWKNLRDGDTSIVWDTSIGGIPVCLLGIESHKVARKGFVPADGPPAWTSGTLFPQSSRKTARAINAASHNRPLVVLANLSGFDGSPESMRMRQLEYGAEIGRAVTNFKGPIVFVVVSRYHGGAFVVFSKALNESMVIAAVEGSVASVIGGTPAAATVFARDVKQRTEADPRVKAARKALAAASGAEAARLRAALAQVSEQVRSEKLGEVAAEFDTIHDIERARRVGSVDRIIKASEIRPYIVDALERGMARTIG